MLRWFQIVLVFFLLFPISTEACSPPDTLWNQADDLGRKQGNWRKYYPNGELMYRGFFRDDQPMGEMLRYYDDGKLSVRLDYSEKPGCAYAVMYFKNGLPGAIGKYQFQKRDSIWNYYSFYSGALTHQETYRMGLKNGVSKTFYPDESVAEIISWKDDMKHGEWKQFFEDSTLRLSSSYDSGQLQGPYRVYNGAQILIMEGSYNHGKMDGDWKFYDKEGKLERVLHYKNGELHNQEELEKWAKEFMDNVEKDLGKIPEPDLNNFFERSP